MRYSDFKIVENTQELTIGPPYPQEDNQAVRAMQSRLEQLGYSVGNTGIDGKYGPRTARAVAAFKQDANISGDGNSMDSAALEKLSTARKLNNPTPTGNDTPIAANDVDVDMAEVKEIVNEFLGNELNDNEINILLRATAAEASRNAQERAAVAAVILNRVRSNRFPNSLRGVLTQRNQFQAVTGTRYNPGPSRNFSGMSASTGRQVAAAIVQYLPNMDKTWLNFTSNNPRAYGRGTNINFMYAMRRAPDSQVIGQTVFGTA